MKKNLRKSSLSLLVFFMFTPLIAAQAAQDVVYKEARPLKQIADVEALNEKDRIEGAGGKIASYLYDPTGMTDPFKPFIAEPKEVDKKKKLKPKSYLETVGLSQLELIAVIVGPKGNWAMVRDSKGTGHVIKKGTLIGTGGGAVYSITDKAVIIREEYKDFKGKTQYKDTAKKVPSLE